MMRRVLLALSFNGILRQSSRSLQGIEGILRARLLPWRGRRLPPELCRRWNRVCRDTAELCSVTS